jgi:hypothetical protein
MLCYKKRIIAGIYIVLCCAGTSKAQVTNNNIQDGSVLVQDAAYTKSSTSHATVEWDCINKSLKALTHKCLIYHNDQWFMFRVNQPGKYYLNIASLACRDARGIQAIILQGNPCTTKQYKILTCIPKIEGDDVFIEIDSLTAENDYFVNIDGFLGDFCKFEIQLSSNPKGFLYTSKSLDTLSLKIAVTGKVVDLHWTASELLLQSLERFEVYRKRKGEAALHIAEFAPVLNAAGKYITNYSAMDALSAAGIYTYDVVAVYKDSYLKEVLDRQTITYRPSENHDPFLHVSLDYKTGTKIQLMLVDEMRDVVLKQNTFVFDAKRDTQQKIYIGDYLNKGINNFLVISTNLKTFEKRVYKFTATNR